MSTIVERRLAGREATRGDISEDGFGFVGATAPQTPGTDTDFDAVWYYGKLGCNVKQIWHSLHDVQGDPAAWLRNGVPLCLILLQLVAVSSEGQGLLCTNSNASDANP